MSNENGPAPLAKGTGPEKFAAAKQVASVVQSRAERPSRHRGVVRLYRGGATR